MKKLAIGTLLVGLIALGGCTNMDGMLDTFSKGLGSINEQLAKINKLNPNVADLKAPKMSSVVFKDYRIHFDRKWGKVSFSGTIVNNTSKEIKVEIMVPIYNLDGTVYTTSYKNLYIDAHDIYYLETNNKMWGGTDEMRVLPNQIVTKVYQGTKLIGSSNAVISHKKPKKVKRAIKPAKQSIQTRQTRKRIG